MRKVTRHRKREKKLKSQMHVKSEGEDLYDISQRDTISTMKMVECERMKMELKLSQMLR